MGDRFICSLARARSSPARSPRRSGRAALLVAGALTTLGAWAQAPTREGPSPALAQLPSVLGVRLAEMKLADVQKALGKAAPVDNGLRAAAEAQNLCYRGADGTILLFSARTESAHGDGLTGFQLVRELKRAHYGEEDEFDGAQPKKPKCARLAGLSRQVTTSGISLASTRAQVLGKLGKPALETPARLKYEGHLEAGEWTTQLTLSVELENDQVVAIRASAIASN